MANAVIYDFESLSQNPIDGVALCMALVTFDRERFFKAGDLYTYDELLHKTKYIKFNVEDQVKNWGRKIQKDTLQWWSEQSKEAQELLKPEPDDHTIAELYPFFIKHVKIEDLKVVYTRNNTFDPIFLNSILVQTGHELPYKWWLIRDTKSTIDGMAWGQNDIRDSFIPPGLEDHFVAHDPRHDVVMDVMRLQYLSNILCPVDEVPW